MAVVNKIDPRYIALTDQALAILTAISLLQDRLQESCSAPKCEFDTLNGGALRKQQLECRCLQTALEALFWTNCCNVYKVC